MPPSPVLDLVRERLAAVTHAACDARGALSLELAPGDLPAVAERLKSEFGFDLLLEVTAADRHARSPRFDVVYGFYSSVHRVRIRLQTCVPEDDPTLDTLVPLYGCARRMEDECHDLYGIVFRGNPDPPRARVDESDPGRRPRRPPPDERERRPAR